MSDAYHPGRTLTYAEMIQSIRESTPAPKGRLTPTIERGE